VQASDIMRKEVEFTSRFVLFQGFILLSEPLHGFNIAQPTLTIAERCFKLNLFPFEICFQMRSNAPPPESQEGV